jgi:rod shape-determining protein MreC
VANRGGSRTRLLLVTLLVTSLFFITLDLRGIGVTQQARSVSSTVLAPIQRVISDAFSPVGNFFSNVKNFGNIKHQVTTLESENSALKEQIIKDKDSLGLYKDLQKNFNLAGNAGFEVKPARVIGRGSSSSFSQTITIDAGTSDGVRTDMTVINGDGIVGVVKSVGSTTAIVELMSDPNFKMGVRIAGSSSAGVLTGVGSNSYNFQLLDPAGAISQGDQLLTLGSDNNRPFVPGIPVGYISKVTTTSADLTQEGVVVGYANLNALGIVSVVLKGADHDLRDSLIPPKPSPVVAPVVAPTIVATPTITATNPNTSNTANTPATPKKAK